MSPLHIELARGAEENGLAVMVADLLRQNLEGNPHKRADFDKMDGSVCIVAEDAEVAMTLRFRKGALTIHDGIVGIPDVTIRAQSDTIIAMSNLPSTYGLPIPRPNDKVALDSVKQVIGDVRGSKLHIYGLLFNLPLVARFSKVMSVNG